MNSQIRFADTLSNLMKLLEALHAIEPNRYLDQIKKASTAGELYDAALALRYAANSKELRDTWDERVHILLNEIGLQITHLDCFFTIKISPSSHRQKQEWEKSVSRDPRGKYAFRDDGSLEISLLDSELRGPMLHVKRIWNHVCNFDGSWIDFKIKLDAAQVTDIQPKLAAARSLQI